MTRLLNGALLHIKDDTSPGKFVRDIEEREVISPTSLTPAKSHGVGFTSGGLLPRPPSSRWQLLSDLYLIVKDSLNSLAFSPSLSLQVSLTLLHLAPSFPPFNKHPLLTFSFFFSSSQICSCFATFITYTDPSKNMSSVDENPVDIAEEEVAEVAEVEAPKGKMTVEEALKVNCVPCDICG